MRALRQMLCKEVPRKNDSSFWIYKFLLIWVSKWIKESQENRSSGSPVCSCVLFPLSSRSSFLTSYLFACAHILSSFPAVLFPDKLLEKSSLSLGAPFACLICSAPAFCPLVLCSLKHTAGTDPCMLKPADTPKALSSVSMLKGYPNVLPPCSPLRLLPP